MAIWRIEITESDTTYGFKGGQVWASQSAAFDVDWGDGTIESKSFGQYDQYPLITHEYTWPGVYTIQTPGSAEFIRSFGAVNAQCVKEIVSLSDNGIQPGQFADCINLEHIPDELILIRNGFYSGLPTFDISNTFYNCEKLKKIKIYMPPNYNPTTLSGSGSGFSASSACVNCKSLETFEIIFSPSFPDNVSYNFLMASDMFSGCLNLNSFISRGKYPIKLSNGTFENCSSLRSVTFEARLSDNNIPASTFRNCTSLESFYYPLAATIGESAFEGCTALEDINIYRYTLTGPAVFKNCTSLKSVIGREIILSGGSSYRDIFAYDRNLSNLPPITFSSGSALFDNAFRNCSSLTEIPFNLPIDDFSLIAMNHMYAGCGNMKGTVDLSLYQDRTGVSNLTGYNCFLGCISLDNYSDIDPEWGGGISINNQNSFELKGKINTLITLDLGEELQIDDADGFSFSAESMPVGFSCSADGIISGITASSVIGAYYVDIILDDSVLKTLIVNFRVTSKEDVVVDIGTIGYKIGNKFIKVVV